MVKRFLHILKKPVINPKPCDSQIVHCKKEWVLFARRVTLCHKKFLSVFLPEGFYVSRNMGFDGEHLDFCEMRNKDIRQAENKRWYVKWIVYLGRILDWVNSKG